MRNINALGTLKYLIYSLLKSSVFSRISHLIPQILYVLPLISYVPHLTSYVSPGTRRVFWRYIGIGGVFQWGRITVRRKLGVYYSANVLRIFGRVRRILGGWDREGGRLREGNLGAGGRGI